MARISHARGAWLSAQVYFCNTRGVWHILKVPKCNFLTLGVPSPYSGRMVHARSAPKYFLRVNVCFFVILVVCFHIRCLGTWDSSLRNIF